MTRRGSPSRPSCSTPPRCSRSWRAPGSSRGSAASTTRPRWSRSSASSPRSGRSRLRVNRGLLLLSPLLWTPLAIVAAKGFLGVDLYRAFGPAWIAANLAFGLAVIPLAIAIARRFSARFENSPLLQHLADDIAGRSLASATRQLEDIRRFEEE